MIPDYQTLMRSVLECASAGETRIGDAIEQLACTDKIGPRSPIFLVYGRPHPKLSEDRLAGRSVKFDWKK
jgi:hypothetical protein